ncbi:hypothetical protein AAE478_009859 [Parahypoxylon ruwenzoriense]
MIIAAVVALVATFAQLTSAHFMIKYPPWRADTLENSDYDQWVYPCGGVPAGVGNRTDWPLTGGSVKLHLFHPWTYLYINLGFGNGTTDFNVSLTPNLMNVTGSGNFCIPELPVPAKVSDGQLATLQIVTNGQSGSALYNCADITFRSAAKLLDSNYCKNDTNMVATIVGQSSTASNATAPADSTTSVIPNSATGTAVRGMTIAAVVGLACVFATGMTL